MKKKTKIKAPPKYIMIPAYIILAIIAVLPAAVCRTGLPLSDAELLLVPNNGGIYTDFCLRLREYILFAAGIFLLLFWAGERIFPDEPQSSALLKNKSSRIILVLSGAYLLFAVISCVFSQYREICFRGISSESQGLAASMGCVILFLISYEKFGSGKAKELLGNAAFCAAALIALMFAAELILGPLPEIIWGVSDFRAGTALLFGNPAACGEFCAILLPVLIMSAFGEKKTALVICKALCAGALICVIISSLSTAALYAAIFGAASSALFLIITRAPSLKAADAARAGIFSRLRSAVIPAAAILLFPALLMIFSPTNIAGQLANAGAYSPDGSFGLTALETNGGELTLRGAKKDIEITLIDENNAELRGGDLTARLSPDSPSCSDPSAPISVTLSGRLMTIDMGYADTIEFETTDGIFMYIGLNGYLTYPPAETAFAEWSGFFRFGTGRGYIWLNSLPILKKCLIKGVGAGGFAFYFPQDDVVGMLNTHGTAALLTDKPHCAYLGTAISYGIPALIAFICLALTALKRGFASAVRERSGAAFGLAASVCAYLIMAVANDDSPVYTPLFWIFAGALCRPSEEAADKHKE